MLDTRSGEFTVTRTRFTSAEKDLGAMTTDRQGLDSSSMKARLKEQYRGKKALFKSQEPLIKEMNQIHKHEYQLE